MGFHLKRIAATGAVLGFLTLLAFLWCKPRVKAKSHEVEETRTEVTNQRRVQRRTSVVAEAFDTDVEHSGCGEPTRVRARFEDAVSVCHDELLAAGCPTPLAQYKEQEEVQIHSEALDEILERCGPDVADGIELDCAHIPCIVLARSDTINTATRCLAPYAALPASRTINGWRPIAWSHREDEPMFVFFRSAIELRADQRLTRLEHALQRGLRTSDVTQSMSCDEQARIQPEIHGCAPVLQALGCTADRDTSIPLDDIEDYLEQTQQMVDEHADDCPGFTTSDWHLDCSDVPCILVIRGLESEPDTDFKTLGCKRDWWQNAVSQDTDTEDFGRLLTVTVWGEWSDHEGMNSRYNQRKTSRYIQALHAGLPGSGVWQ